MTCCATLTRTTPSRRWACDERAVDALLGALSPRQRQVIVRRFGLAGHDAATPDAIALALGVTRARVQQLESEALDRMHRHLRPRDLAARRQPGAAAAGHPGEPTRRAGPRRGGLSWTASNGAS